jgi:predicted amidohydrolase YtcJ
MTQLNRRTLLQGALGAMAGATGQWPSRVWAAPKTAADLVLRNGALVTMSDKLPAAEAMAVRGGRIVGVGSQQEIEPLIGPQTKVIDLAGKGVSPGLIDAHSHVIGFAQMQLKFVLLRPPKVDSFDTLRRELAKAAAEKPAGEWIVGRGFDSFREGRFPRRSELDEAAGNHPVLIIHWGGQFGVANTLALKQAGLLRSDVQDPYGGKYLRDRRSGLPDGVLVHYPAIYSVYMPALSERERIDCAVWGLDQFARLGVTCIHDNFVSPLNARSYVRLEQSGRLPCRIRVYPYVANLQHCQTLVKEMRRYEAALIRLQGIKLAVDGYALMYDVPAEHRHLAIPMHPQPQFEAIIAAIHQADFQADVHAVGDKGVDWTLEAFAKAAGSAAECRRRRHRIEHFPLRKLDSIRRAADLGVPVCTQPEFVRLKADDFRRRFGPRGPDLVRTMIPVATFVREGVPLAYGADVPAFPSHSPLDSIRRVMDRKTGSGDSLDSSEAVSFLDALRHHTLGGAYASFDEKELGSLEPGKCADFVIWNTDLRQIRTSEQVATIKPEATYLGGKAVFSYG